MELFPTIDAEKIQAGMIAKRWTMAELSRRAGVGYSALRDLLQGRRQKAHRNTLLKLADALDVKPDELAM